MEEVREQIALDTTKIEMMKFWLITAMGCTLKSTYFKDHPQALRLHFYEDEFEIVNPLGDKKKKKVQNLCFLWYSWEHKCKISLKAESHSFRLNGYPFTCERDWAWNYTATLDSWPQDALHVITSPKIWLDGFLCLSILIRHAILYGLTFRDPTSVLWVHLCSRNKKIKCSFVWCPW